MTTNKATKLKRFTIDICEGCIGEEGEMCDTPGCAFCWRSTSEVKDLLSACQIKISVDGQPMMCQAPLYEYDEGSVSVDGYICALTAELRQLKEWQKEQGASTL